MASLVAITVVACSDNTSKMSESSSTEKSSTAQPSSSKEASTSSSSEVATSQTSWLTDEEIKSAKTIGDYKKIIC